MFENIYYILHIFKPSIIFKQRITFIFAKDCYLIIEKKHFREKKN